MQPNNDILSLPSLVSLCLIDDQISLCQFLTILRLLLKRYHTSAVIDNQMIKLNDQIKFSEVEKKVKVNFQRHITKKTFIFSSAPSHGLHRSVEGWWVVFFPLSLFVSPLVPLCVYFRYTLWSPMVTIYRVLTNQKEKKNDQVSQSLCCSYTKCSFFFWVREGQVDIC